MTAEKPKVNHTGAHFGATNRECDMVVGRIWGAIADIVPVDVNAYDYKQAYLQIQRIVKDVMR